MDKLEYLALLLAGCLYFFYELHIKIKYNTEHSILMMRRRDVIQNRVHFSTNETRLEAVERHTNTIIETDCTRYWIGLCFIAFMYTFSFLRAAHRAHIHSSYINRYLYILVDVILQYSHT